MEDVVIEASQLGKRYRLSRLRDGRLPGYQRTLRDTIGDGLERVFQRNGAGLRTEEFWALKNVDFEIRRGEVVGIIGRNGAGKSTLLKILSRITDPSEGRVRIKGRVASLLEVGTGFHPELTGRENMFLNGAILGMSRAEIKAKFDEIVAFAEIEKFLDTPVKRYSSGMYVRLAFAVAAHLEPEILIIDEVLAVGDAEFQRKCMGKMRDVASAGRTVLFVSHNMAAVSSLTTRCALLEGGALASIGRTSEVVQRYVAVRADLSGGQSQGRLHRGRHSQILSAFLVDESGQPTRQHGFNQPFRLRISFYTDGSPSLSLDLLLVAPNGDKIALGSLGHFEADALPQREGEYTCEMVFAPLCLASGLYTFDVATAIINQTWDDYTESAISFEVPFSNPKQSSLDFKYSYGFGSVALLCSTPPQIRLNDRSSPGYAKTASANS